MLISVRATAAYDLPEQTFLLLMVEPPLVGPVHRVEQERLLTTPTPFHELGTDVYGNPQRRISASNGCETFDLDLDRRGKATEVRSSEGGQPRPGRPLCERDEENFYRSPSS